jgi:hypothetical protein
MPQDSHGVLEALMTVVRAHRGAAHTRVGESLVHDGSLSVGRYGDADVFGAQTHTPIAFANDVWSVRD